MTSLKKHAVTAVVALASAALVTAAPAIAHGVEHALFAHNADKVDGIHAAKTPKASTLLALNGKKQFPASAIPKRSIVSRSKDITVADGTFTTGQIDCNAGERATGGGARAAGLAYAGYKLVSSYPAPLDAAKPTGWSITVYTESGTSGTVRIYAICTKY